MVFLLFLVFSAGYILIRCELFSLDAGEIFIGIAKWYMRVLLSRFLTAVLLARASVLIGVEFFNGIR